MPAMCRPEELPEPGALMEKKPGQHYMSKEIRPGTEQTKMGDKCGFASRYLPPPHVI